LNSGGAHYYRLSPRGADAAAPSGVAVGCQINMGGDDRVAGWAGGRWATG